MRQDFNDVSFKIFQKEKIHNNNNNFKKKKSWQKPLSKLEEWRSNKLLESLLKTN
jgi:hypothetical protein